MGTTQQKVADNGLRAVLLAALPEDMSAPTATELNGAVAIHCQLSGDDWPIDPSTKEYDANSWCTGGQDVMVRSQAINFTISQLTLKDMTDEPDTVRGAWSTGTQQCIAYRIGDANTEDVDFAVDDEVYLVPVEVGLVIDLPQREGTRVYSPELSYAGGGRISTVVAGA